MTITKQSVTKTYDTTGAVRWLMLFEAQRAGQPQAYTRVQRTYKTQAGAERALAKWLSVYGGQS